MTQVDFDCPTHGKQTIKTKKGNLASIVICECILAVLVKSGYEFSVAFPKVTTKESYHA